MKIPDELINALVKSKSVAVLTGAGISAESGIKTFRDPDGLWSKFNPAELASMDGFMSNPTLVWEWYQLRRDVINQAEPNPGHYAIVEMQKLFKDFTLITQNVDRLHQKAGSVDVAELHGNIIDNFCIRCKSPFLEQISSDTKDVPICKECGGMIRPAVVWFGEMLPYEALMRAESAAKRAQVFITAGTSAEVYPAANLPLIARQSGAVVVEINPNETAISSYMDFCLREPSGVALPQIISAFKAKGGI
jgi:NAD-dependent deacetylase